MIERSPFVRRHPSPVRSHNIQCIPVHAVELFGIAFGDQVLAQRIQEDRVRPVPFRIEQMQIVWILIRMYAASNQLFRLVQVPLRSRQHPGIDQSIDGIPRAATWAVKVFKNRC